MASLSAEATSILAQCRSCISNSTEKIVDIHCPNAMNAIIWYEKCQLRYSNSSFFGRLDVQDSGYWYWLNDKVEDPADFNKKLRKFLKSLASRAVTQPSRLMFAAGNIPYDELQTVYGLVQCTGDTSIPDCGRCLNSTIYRIPTTCENAGGCEIVTGSCRVRFDTQRFYENATAPFPSPIPSPLPNSAPPSDSGPLYSGESNLTSG